MANKKVMKAWVAALRSGDYTQCQGALRRNNGDSGYCCLGVLADIAVKQPELGDVALPAIKWNGSPGAMYSTADSLAWTTDNGTRRNEQAMPPEEIRWWAGIPNWTVDRNNTTIPEDDQWLVEAEAAGEDPGRIPFTHLNDTVHATFGEIADMIEKEYIDA